MLSSSALYAAIDLGSNSFHMLVVREVAGSIQTLARIKRKVRLAAGLDQNNHLSQEAMQRGWQCLKLFSERLQDIPREQIRVVATATLRLACNADEFLQTAEQILGCPIQVISGEEEARLIYHGVAHTTGGPDQRLVVDIGGGSTELVTGTGAQAAQLYSLSMGCVTWLERFSAIAIWGRRISNRLNRLRVKWCALLRHSCVNTVGRSASALPAPSRRCRKSWLRRVWMNVSPCPNCVS